MKKFLLILFLSIAACAQAPVLYHAGDVVRFSLQFSDRKSPHRVEAEFVGAQDDFYISKLDKEKDHVVVYGKVPKFLKGGTYQLKSILLVYYGRRVVLTPPRDFPEYEIEVK